MGNTLDSDTTDISERLGEISNSAESLHPLLGFCSALIEHQGRKNPAL